MLSSCKKVSKLLEDLEIKTQIIAIFVITN